MKKYYIVFLLMAFVISSCEKYLEETPQDIITTVNFYKTAKDAETAVLGMYAVAQTNTYSYHLVELHADYTQALGSWGPMSNWDVPLDPVHIGRVESYIWNPCYNAINRANSVLDNVPQVVMDETKKKSLLAEAYFIRAFNYFTLVRGFGPVPLRLTSTKKVSQTSAPRVSVEEVYDQIIKDLTIAETDLIDSRGLNTGRACKWAAKMLLADVYLTREDWSNAATKANEVIASGQYSLVLVTVANDFYKMYATQTHSEDIMSLHFTSTIVDGYVTTLHRANVPAYNNQSSGFYTILPHFPVNKFNNNWDNKDLRKSFNHYSSYVNAAGATVTLPSTTPVLYKKYIARPDGIRSNSRPTFRYTEAFLIYAEAAAMANGSPTALALERLNMIKRRGYGYNPTTVSPVDYPSGMNLIDFRNAVLQERAYEFINEFRRWWDLKRTGKAKATIEAEWTGKIFSDYRLLWPIPQSEIDNNPALTQSDQNPGY